MLWIHLCTYALSLWSGSLARVSSYKIVGQSKKCRNAWMLKEENIDILIIAMVTALFLIFCTQKSTENRENEKSS